MPTPFFHLSLAQEILAQPDLPAPLRHLEPEARAAFWLGSTAPDLSAVSGQARPATHFFNVPIPRDEAPPWQGLFQQHPYLAQAAQLPQVLAAFVAGYVCHLQADYFWVQQVFWPSFRPSLADAAALELRHNVLRVYQERQVLDDLNGQVRTELGRAPVVFDGLPFLHAADLRLWRDRLASQLGPGAENATIQIFAARQGITPTAFYDLLASPTRLQAEVFSRVPPHTLEDYRQAVLRANYALLRRYYAPNRFAKEML
jgi:hypothetical protein